MRMEVKQLARGLDGPGGSRGDAGVVEVGRVVELESSRGTAGATQRRR